MASTATGSTAPQTIQRLASEVELPEEGRCSGAAGADAGKMPHQRKRWRSMRISPGPLPAAETPTLRTTLGGGSLVDVTESSNNHRAPVGCELARCRICGDVSNRPPADSDRLVHPSLEMNGETCSPTGNWPRAIFTLARPQLGAAECRPADQLLADLSDGRIEQPVNSPRAASVAGKGVVGRRSPPPSSAAVPLRADLHPQANPWSRNCSFAPWELPVAWPMAPTP